MTMDTPCTLMAPTPSTDSYGKEKRIYSVGNERDSVCSYNVTSSEENVQGRDTVLMRHALRFPWGETIDEGYRVRVDGETVELTSVLKRGSNLDPFWECHGKGVKA